MSVHSDFYKRLLVVYFEKYGDNGFEEIPELRERFRQKIYELSKKDSNIDLEHEFSLLDAEILKFKANPAAYSGHSLKPENTTDAQAQENVSSTKVEDEYVVIVPSRIYPLLLSTMTMFLVWLGGGFTSGCRPLIFSNCYDSGWVSANNKEHNTLVLSHNLGYLPTSVTLMFSPDINKDEAWPIAYRWESGSGNPVNIAVDVKDVKVHISKDASLRNLWSPQTGWKSFSEGHVRVALRLN